MSTPEPPYAPPPPLPSPDAPPRKLPSWCLPVGVGCGCLGIVALVAIIGLGWFGLRVTNESAFVGVDATVPDLAVGEEGDMVLTILNRKKDKALEVNTVSVSTEFLDGFSVLSITPTPQDSTSIFSKMQYTLHASIPAGQSATVTWHLRATQAGPREGRIDVDGPMYIANAYIKADVRAAGSP